MVRVTTPRLGNIRPYGTPFKPRRRAFSNVFGSRTWSIG